ncbi:hypothetical protein [Pelagicoccus albus]
MLALLGCDKNPFGDTVILDTEASVDYLPLFSCEDGKNIKFIFHRPFHGKSTLERSHVDTFLEASDGSKPELKIEQTETAFLEFTISRQDGEAFTLGPYNYQIMTIVDDEPFPFIGSFTLYSGKEGFKSLKENRQNQSVDTTAVSAPR